MKVFHKNRARGLGTTVLNLDNKISDTTNCVSSCTISVQKFI